MSVDPGPRRRAVARLAAAQVLVLALWFSASAAVPALARDGELGAAALSLLTSAVQAGFVVGTLLSAILGLPDRMDPRRLFALCALVGAVANASIVLFAPDSLAVLVLRFITGASLAGVYPVGMKLVAGWARDDLGLMVGLLVGALTLGSAAPHLFAALGGVNWHPTLLTASGCAVLGAALIRGFPLGPGHRRAPAFEPAGVLALWRDRAARLATAGYLGHMWELYAMWAWIGVFLSASFQAWGERTGTLAPFDLWAGLATFLTVAAGAPGAIAAGILADRHGRTAVTLWSMGVSGACCLIAGWLFGAHPGVLLLLCVVWGASVVADSAQFSACVAEVADPTRVGTMLTAQTCLGFTLTLVTLHVMPHAVTAAGWQGAFSLLAVGPALGCVAMWRLRRSPQARRLAGGRR